MNSLLNQPTKAGPPSLRERPGKKEKRIDSPQINSLQDFIHGFGTILVSKTPPYKHDIYIYTSIYEDLFAGDSMNDIVEISYLKSYLQELIDKNYRKFTFPVSFLRKVGNMIYDVELSCMATDNEAIVVPTKNQVQEQLQNMS